MGKNSGISIFGVDERSGVDRRVPRDRREFVERRSGAERRTQGERRQGNEADPNQDLAEGDGVREDGAPMVVRSGKDRRIGERRQDYDRRSTERRSGPRRED